MGGPLSAWRAWREQREIMRDMRRRAADASEMNRFKVKDQLTYAQSAIERNDYRQATAIWEKLLLDHPADAYKSPLALQVLLGLRRFDEATTMMLNGRKRSPSDPFFLRGLGDIAQYKGDLNEAIAIYAKLRKRFPGVIEGYTSATSALRKLNRPDEAEELARQAMRHFPDKIHGVLEYARSAVYRQDWEEALRRWQPVREQFQYFGAYVGAAEALIHLGRYDEAEEILQQARYRFGTNPGPVSELARLAEAKGDTELAIERWKGVMYRFPLDKPVYSMVSEAFERLGQPAEAAATLRAAVERFPADLSPRVELAKLFHYKHRDFPAAVEAWASLRQAFPDNEVGYINGAEALRHAGRADEAAALREEHRIRFNAA